MLIDLTDARSSDSAAHRSRWGQTHPDYHGLVVLLTPCSASRFKADSTLNVITAKTAIAVTKEVLAEQTNPVDLVGKYMVPAMDEAGRRFEAEEYFVPELFIAARAMKGALELIRLLLAASGAQPAGRVVVGTVKGDLHDIGRNLMASMLEGGGFEVIDLGADLPPEKSIEAVKTDNANIVALSALPAMRPSRPSMP